VRRALLVAAVLGLVLLALPVGAGATNECKGLDVCISVPGPWVAVPTAPPGGASTAVYQVTCPKRSVAGGLDAILGDPTLEVRWLGLLGSPINPGISTKRSVVFQAVSGRSRPTAFRPVVGCIPTSGGGGRSTTAYTAPPKAKPVQRRFHTVSIRGTHPVGVITACARGERIVGTTYAVGFRTRLQPSPAVLAGVDVTLRRQGGLSYATVRRTAAVPSAMHVLIQVQLLCARGPS
jgi:hypothetical protein